MILMSTTNNPCPCVYRCRADMGCEQIVRPPNEAVVEPAFSGRLVEGLLGKAAKRREVPNFVCQGHEHE